MSYTLGRRKPLRSVLSGSSVWSVLVDQLLDVEFSDEILDDWVLEVDVGDLDL